MRHQFESKGAPSRGSHKLARTVESISSLINRTLASASPTLISPQCWRLGPKSIATPDPIGHGLKQSAWFVSRARRPRSVDAELRMIVAVGIRPQVGVGQRAIGLAVAAAGAVAFREQNGFARTVGKRFPGNAGGPFETRV